MTGLRLILKVFGDQTIGDIIGYVNSAKTVLPEMLVVLHASENTQML